MQVPSWYCECELPKDTLDSCPDGIHTVYLNGRKQVDVVAAWRGENDEPGTVILMVHDTQEPPRRIRLPKIETISINTPGGIGYIETEYELAWRWGDVRIEKKTKHPREILEEMGRGRLHSKASPHTEESHSSR